MSFNRLAAVYPVHFNKVAGGDLDTTRQNI